MARPRKPKDQHKKGGKPPWAPTPEQRAEIRGMAMANIPLEVIATIIGKDEKTLVKHCPDEIRTGRSKLLGAAAVQTARFVYGAKAEYDDRNNIIRAEVKPEQAACFFVLKTQGKAYGWSERMEVTGANGGSLFNDLDLSKLNGKELDQLEILLRKCGVGAAPRS